MNFLSMKYFCAVERERSITKAAEKLYITQQTLSAHIASVEREVGSRLFVRHSPLELTHAGKVFLRYAAQFEALTLSMEREFADIRLEKSGVLRVGVSHTRGRAIMPGLIVHYQSAYPKMQVTVVEADNDLLPRGLLNRELDIIVADIPDNIPEIAWHPFYEEEVVLLISHTLLDTLYGSSKEDIVADISRHSDLSPLSKCPFLLSNQEDIAGRIGARMIAQAGFVPHVSTQSGNIETLLELCARGIGACFCPEILVRKTLPPHILSGIQLFRFGNPASYQIKLGWLRQPYIWGSITNFVNTAIALSGQLLENSPGQFS